MPERIGTDIVKALDVANRLLHRRAIVFLISDFESPKNPVGHALELRRAMRRTNRRHDLIAVHVEDPREKELPDVGIVALEDAETGEVIELDTASAADPQTIQGTVPGKRAPPGERLSVRGRRHPAIADRFALHACAAAILQNPGAQTV